MPGAILTMDPQAQAQADALPPPPPPPVYGFIVSHQRLDLEVDLATQTLSGRTEITILPETGDLQTIKINARQCAIPAGGITVEGKHVEFSHEDPMKLLQVPNYYGWAAEQYEQQQERIRPLALGMVTEGTLEIKVPKGMIEVDPFSEGAAPAASHRAQGVSAARSASFALDGSGAPLSALPPPSATPKTAVEQSSRYRPLVVRISFTASNFRDGLHFVGLDGADERYPHVYTRHSIDTGVASCIFPCVDDPGMRCTWELNINCSRTLGDALKRRPGPHLHKGAHHANGKRGLANGHVDDVVEEYIVPLSDEDKSLEMVVVCSGDMTDEVIDLEDDSKKITSFLCSTVVAPQHIGFAIGPFEQVDLSEFREAEDDEKLEQDIVDISAYCLPGRVDQVRHTCAPLPNALDWFRPTFGNYPFQDYKLVFVDDQLRDTEHTASLSLCSNRLLFDEQIIDPEIEIVRTLVHAISSQWFGVSIVPNERRDTWVTIGISNFMTDLYMKTICGHNWYAFRQKTLSDTLVEMDFERPCLDALGGVLHYGKFEMEFMTLKAPLVMFILDKRVVKSSGSVGLTRVISRLIVTANTGTSTDSMVSSESFRRLVEKVTKYRQTDSFWKQWVLGSGCPKFLITQRFNKKRLCVELTINQIQQVKEAEAQAHPKHLEPASFRRLYKEHVKFVWANPVEVLFTGPMTIRIHEADGTPYEHVVEIRDRLTKIDIPYNTKYKRLKRTRRQKERMNAGAVDPSGEGGDEALYYCLGDVLQSKEEMGQWGLQEWDQAQEQAMEQESFEWIRVDADFEWICSKDFKSMPSYMWVSQLQQDRDVVAQQESMLYLRDPIAQSTGHPLIATFLVRTLMDPRYYHGIRTMAAATFKNHYNALNNFASLIQLEKAYQEFFCIPGTKTPRPNDFSDKKAYHVEMAIAKALSTLRDTEGKCPKGARRLILDMLQLNDNSSNLYSDEYKIANLLIYLTESIIPHKDVGNMLNMEDDDEEMDLELEDFKNIVITNLDRYQRRDAWMNSYQNIFTVTSLECKQRLMKAKIIPVDPVEFAQFLHDGNSEPVRIKAFEALMNLGFLKQRNVAALLLSSLSTDRSPHTRDQIFEVFCLGLADVAFVDKQAAASVSAVPAPAPALAPAPQVGENDEMQIDKEEPEGGLIVETEVATVPEKPKEDRTNSLVFALPALREELKDNEELKNAIWKAIQSSVIGVHEQSDLLDICFALYSPIRSLTLKFRLPRYWKVVHLGKGKLKFRETDKVQNKPLKSRKPPESLKQPISSVIVEPPKVLPAPQLPRPNGQIRLSFSNSHTQSAQPIQSPLSIQSAKPAPQESLRTMKPPRPPKRPPATDSLVSPRPPKRPLVPERNQISEERPHKIVKLKINSQKVQEILRRPSNPTLVRTKLSKKSSSPAFRPSPAPKPSPSIIASSPSTITISPASSTTITAVPNAGAGAGTGTPPVKVRKPLPDSAPRPHFESTSALPASKKLIIKIKTGSGVKK